MGDPTLTPVQGLVILFASIVAYAVGVGYLVLQYRVPVTIAAMLSTVVVVGLIERWSQ